MNSKYANPPFQRKTFVQNQHFRELLSEVEAIFISCDDSEQYKPLQKMKLQMG